MQYFTWACLLGALSAVSLPLGSWCGLRFRFTSNQISVMAAFGAGALLAALSVELIAPTTLALVEPGGQGEHAAREFVTLVVGCVLGGIVYVLLDHQVNKRGGFLRRTSTVLRYYRKLNREEQEKVLEKLAAIPLFQSFPAEHVETLMSVMEPAVYKDKEIIVEQHKPADHP